MRHMWTVTIEQRHFIVGSSRPRTPASFTIGSVISMSVAYKSEDISKIDCLEFGFPTSNLQYSYAGIKQKVRDQSLLITA